MVQFRKFSCINLQLGCTLILHAVEVLRCVDPKIKKGKKATPLASLAIPSHAGLVACMRCLHAYINRCLHAYFYSLAYTHKKKNNLAFRQLYYTVLVDYVTRLSRFWLANLLLYSNEGIAQLVRQTTGPRFTKFATQTFYPILMVNMQRERTDRWQRAHKNKHLCDFYYIFTAA